MVLSRSRRDFLKLTALGLGTVVLSSGLAACDDDLSSGLGFAHRVASGDPLQDRIILWTRVTPLSSAPLRSLRIGWELALDPEFSAVVRSGTGETSAERDYTLKIDAVGLLPGTVYYYRFRTRELVSPVGRTRTLPDVNQDRVQLAVVSCSNYPAGRFYVYRELAARQDLDAVLHLGDYIYEYERGGYASSKAAAMGREVLPDHELLSLSDYRTRYAQYRSDPDLQALHQNHPMIAVWDDHEVANDAWRAGAQNHQAGEGDYEARKLNALRAYSEWMPLRPMAPDDMLHIYRSFRFGRLVQLHMLDTRLLARDKPHELIEYFSLAGFDLERFQRDRDDPERTMLGSAQRDWLLEQLAAGDAPWQVLGQQVLMARMELPGAIASQQLTLADFGRLAKLAEQVSQGHALPESELDFYASKKHLLGLPSLPYNLDAWDGYEAERRTILEAARDASGTVVVLAGDSHNGWASELLAADSVATAVEFAAPSVSSPGLESYLGIGKEEALMTEQQVQALIPTLKYANIQERGWLLLSFTEHELTATYSYVESVTSETYRPLPQRARKLRVKAGTARILPG